MRPNNNLKQKTDDEELFIPKKTDNVLNCSNDELNKQNITKILYILKLFAQKYSKQERYNILSKIDEPNKIIVDELNMLRKLYNCK